MKARTLIAFRAYAVLLSISVSVAMLPCFAFAEISALLSRDAPHWTWQLGTGVVALGVMLLLRGQARSAFRWAFYTGHVKGQYAAEPIYEIADDCPRAWLVQMHLELSGQRCTD